MNKRNAGLGTIVLVIIAAISIFIGRDLFVDLGIDDPGTETAVPLTRPHNRRQLVRSLLHQPHLPARRRTHRRPG